MKHQSENRTGLLPIPIETEQEVRHLILLRPPGSEVLMVQRESNLRLPAVLIPRYQRVAENVTREVSERFGISAFCLFSTSCAVTENPAASDSCSPFYDVLVCRNAGQSAPADCVWVSAEPLDQEQLIDQDRHAVSVAIKEMRSYIARPASCPFGNPFWFGELLSWVREVASPLGFQLSGEFRQLNASASFSLIRFETNGPALWFKAVGKPNLREFPVTRTLAELSPKHLAPIVAVRPEWNGWLSTEVEGANLWDVTDAKVWESAATALARLQIESIGREAPLLQSGMRDLRASTLAKIVQPFFSTIAQLMDRQVKNPPAILGRGELLLLEECIQRALSRTREIGVPEALGHLDLSPGNIVVSRESCRFLDWAEAFVGHPFCSFEYLREFFRRIVGVDPSLEARLAESYAGPWREVLSAAAIAEAQSVAPLLAVFFLAAGTEAWSDPERLQNLDTAAFLRSLARRMKREADRLTVQGSFL